MVSRAAEACAQRVPEEFLAPRPIRIDDEILRRAPVEVPAIVGFGSKQADVLGLHRRQPTIPRCFRKVIAPTPMHTSTRTMRMRLAMPPPWAGRPSGEIGAFAASR